MNLSTSSIVGHRRAAGNRRRLLTSLSGTAVLAGLVTALLGGVPDAAATGQRHGHDHAAPPVRTAAQLAFHDQMRKLWEDHVTWTRLAIVTFADESAGFDATAARLLRNQQDIGDAIKPFYGADAGDRLAGMLRDHIGIAVELLQAAKAGDADALQRARAAWYANADDIADFLAAADPQHWPRDAMRAAMRTHLDQTLAEATHELSGQYAASVADYEEIHHHILQMADLLSTGILHSFPERFRAQNGGLS